MIRYESCHTSLANRAGLRLCLPWKTLILKTVRQKALATLKTKRHYLRRNHSPRAPTCGWRLLCADANLIGQTENSSTRQHQITSSPNNRRRVEVAAALRRRKLGAVLQIGCSNVPGLNRAEQFFADVYDAVFSI